MRRFLVLALLLGLAGCYQSMTGQCWNSAIYAYSTAIANGREAKIFIQETSRSRSEGVYHAQAMAKIDGEWRWLNVYN